MKNYQSKNKAPLNRGLTVVELLAATALASMLMIAVMTTLQTMNRSQKAILKNSTDVPWLTRFSDQLEWELMNSSRISISPDLIQVAGFAGRNMENRSATHVRSLITYRIIKKDKNSFLIREELHPDSVNLKNQQKELVASGIEKILVTSIDVADAVKIKPETVPEQPIYDDSIPKKLAVILYQAGETKPVFNHAFTLH